MTRTRSAVCLTVLAALFLAACGPKAQLFLHTRHREVLSIQPEELRELQFYNSTEILAKDASTPEVTATPGAVIIVSQRTRGRVTEVGPNWLRVAFAEGGSGVAFLTLDAPENNAYWLATETEGQEGLKRLKDLREKVLLHQGTPYEVVWGSDARLLVDRKHLEKLISRRRHLEGEKVKGPK